MTGDDSIANELGDSAADAEAHQPAATAAQVPDGSAARPDASRRDPVELQRLLQRWLTGQLGEEADPVIENLIAPDANGMSSDTLLFDATWTEDGERCVHELVIRVAPDLENMPVFPRYDLRLQFDAMRTVAELTDVPVPDTYWIEESADVLGSPFFVMGRIDGDVPPDVMPYTFGSWLSEATPEEQRRLQESSIAVLAELHAIADPATSFSFLAPPTGVAALRAHVDSSREYYEWVASDGVRHPILDRCFERLEATWPASPGVVLSWGDARIGNTMYRGFRPVAVLDWEMASLAPREVDLAWGIFLHRFFQDIAVTFEMPGMPGFLRREDVEATYAELSGHEPEDMDWYLLYAATRHGAIMARVQRRTAHFNGTPLPDDPDDLIMHRAALEAMLAGTYWNDLPGDP